MDFRYMIGVLALVAFISLLDMAITGARSGVRGERKSHAGGLLLVLILLLCLGLAGKTYLEERGGELPQVADLVEQVALGKEETESVPVIQETGEVVEIPKYDLSDGYYYSQLDSFGQELYEIFYDLAIHHEEPDYKREKRMDENAYQAVGDAFSIAYYAMLEDHPEFFFLQIDNSGDRVDFSGYTIAGMANITLSLKPGRYDERAMIDRFENAVELFLSDIDLNATDYEIEMQIHDKLIDLVSYNHPAAADESDNYALAHTAYAALCDDGKGHANSAVCDGYSAAFQYLLSRAGIQATSISGTAGSIENGKVEEGAHSWNLVMLDGEWYEVDCTWDDLDPEYMDLSEEEVAYMKTLYPEYFAATHWYFNRTTQEMAITPASEKYNLTIPRGNQYVIYYPCHSAYHLRKRDSSLPGYEIFYFLNAMTPEATGTKYGLGL